MGKIVAKKDKSSSGAKEKINLQHTKKQKKKKFWKKHPKIATKQVEIEKISPLLPPKKPEEFSSNWKLLQTLLTSEKTSTITKPPPTKPQAAKPAPPAAAKPPPPPTKPPAAAKPAPPPSAATKPATPPPAKPCKKEKEVSKLEKTKATLLNGQTASTSSPIVKEGPTSDRKPKRAAGDTETTDKKREKRMTLQAEREEKPKHYKKKSAETDVPETPKLDLWFDDVDPDDIEAALGPEAGQIARKMQGLPEKKYDMVDTVLVKDRAFEGLTRTVAIDCEMVGVGTDGEESIVARVSIVNQFGKCIYDKFVKPTERVTDYRTQVSGIRPGDIRNGEDFKAVQKEVSEILKDRILVGHAVHNDLKILLLDHPKKAIRDTQKYKPFKREVKSGRPSLKLLCDKILNVKVQTGEHSSVQDAQAAMRLYTMEKKNWEASIKVQYNKAKVEPQKKKPSSTE